MCRFFKQYVLAEPNKNEYLEQKHLTTNMYRSNLWTEGWSQQRMQNSRWVQNRVPSLGIAPHRAALRLTGNHPGPSFRGFRQVTSCWAGSFIPTCTQTRQAIALKPPHDEGAASALTLPRLGLVKPGTSGFHHSMVALNAKPGSLGASGTEIKLHRHRQRH